MFFYSYSSFGNKIRFCYYFLGIIITNLILFKMGDPICLKTFIVGLFLFLIFGGLFWLLFVSMLSLNFDTNIKEYVSEDYGNHKGCSYYGLYYKRWATLFGKKIACEIEEYFETIFCQEKQQVINLDGKKYYIENNKLYIY